MTTFTNCYSRVNIITDRQYDLGGFNNCTTNSTSKPDTFNKCYYAGNITSSKGKYSRTSAFSGSGSVYNNDNLHGGSILNNCYYNKTLFKLDFAPCGTGLTTTQMGTASSYSGWDFKESDTDTSYTWYIDSETGYPELHF